MTHEAFVRRLRNHPEEGSYIGRFPHYAARYPSGAWAALAMTMEFWDRPASLKELEAEIGSDAMRHGLLPALEHYLWKKDLWVHLSSTTMDGLKDRIDAGVPVMVFLRDDPIRLSGSRFAVAIGYDDIPQEILCHAGRSTPTTYRYGEFEQMWQAGDHRMLLVCPPDTGGWELSELELFDRARFFEKRARYELAIEDYKAALVGLPKESSIYVHLGNIHRILDLDDQAEQDYRKAIETDPLSAKAHNNLAYLLAERRRSLEDSIEHARQAALLEPTNPFILDTLGYVYLRSGHPADAVDAFELARGRAKQFPLEKQAEIAIHLVRAHVANSSDALARQVLTDALRMDPGMNVPEDLQELLRGGN